MITERVHNLGAAPNKIRELFAYGLQRKAEIGEDKVYDFSIGNPSVPAPDSVKQRITELLEEPACALHGYTPSPGDMRARQAVAQHIQKFYDVPATPGQVYMTAGAAAGLAIAIYAVSAPGDQMVTVTPYFPEYMVWAATAGVETVEVPATVPDFQIDVPAMAAAINEKTSCVIINSPNNPTGAVYTRENLVEFCDMLRQKEEEVGHPIYLISDEPYREITYGAEVPYVPPLYEHTIVCYSYSKSLSLPGERIGYIYVSDLMENKDEVMIAVCGAGRALGFICTAALFQRVVETCVDEPSDVEAYRENRELLISIMDELGYEYVQPDGAFYLWVKALEEDDNAFIERAKDFELLIVPGSCFRSVPGWVRLSYCIDKNVIANSKEAFRALKASYEQ